MHPPANPHELWQQLLLRYPVALLVEKTRDQLAADCRRAGCEPPDLPEQEPLVWLEDVAAFLRKLAPEQLAVLLYLVDLPEKWQRDLAQSDNYHQQLARAVLYRELVKVWYKLHYAV